MRSWVPWGFWGMKKSLPSAGRNYTGLRYEESGTIELTYIMKKHLPFCYKRGFFILWATDIWGRIILCCERLSCVFSSMPDLYSLDTSSTNIHHAHPSKNISSGTTKCLVESKIALTENYFYKQKKVTIFELYINLLIPHWQRNGKSYFHSPQLLPRSPKLGWVGDSYVVFLCATQGPGIYYLQFRDCLSMGMNIGTHTYMHCRDVNQDISDLAMIFNDYLASIPVSCPKKTS